MPTRFKKISHKRLMTFRKTIHGILESRFLSRIFLTLLKVPVRWVMFGDPAEDHGEFKIFEIFLSALKLP